MALAISWIYRASHLCSLFMSRFRIVGFLTFCTFTLLAIVLLKYSESETVFEGFSWQRFRWMFFSPTQRDIQSCNGAHALMDKLNGHPREGCIYDDQLTH